MRDARTAMRALALCASAVLALLLLGAPSARAVFPNGCVDADADNICDTGWNVTCCGGDTTKCNDNCVDFFNPDQCDIDRDCRGTATLHGTSPCDSCSQIYNPIKVNVDGDGFDAECDCNDNDPTIPGIGKHCPKRRDDFVLWWIVYVGLSVFLLLLIIGTIYYMRSVGFSLINSEANTIGRQLIGGEITLQQMRAHYGARPVGVRGALSQEA